VGQYFTLYDGVSKEHYQRIVAAAPFDKCNLLILAFVRTFEFDRPSDEGGTIYVAQFANGRDPVNFPLDPNDTDADRVKLIVETARKKNPSINILVSLGWGANDAGKAALTSVAFADSVRALVQAYDLNGFDIDFESTEVEPAAMLALAREIRRSLNKIPSKRPMIMTITPAKDRHGLNKKVLEQFTYIMPQTYHHGGDGTNFKDAEWYAHGLYDRIVYGLNSEGFLDDRDKDRPDDPKKSAAEAKKNRAAGIFAWRLNGDSIKQGFPTFADAVEMWNLMNH
jgi:Glycosyl hydrolases family 18